MTDFRPKLPRPLIVVLLSATMSLLLISSGEAQQNTSPDSNKPNYEITGRVVSKGGESITGAIAYLSSVGGESSRQTARADNSGSFKFSGLARGLYQVFASVPGYMPEPRRDDEGGPTYYHEGDDVTITMIKGGVITGKVRTASDEPVVAAPVRAYRTRDENGKVMENVLYLRERLTDDRGIYRIYGLAPGTYIVSAGGASRFGGPGLISGTETDVPVYAPSATRETASEVYVGNGEEANVDIQYRSDPGHSISGTVSGLSKPAGAIIYSAGVTLIDVQSRASIMSGSSTTDGFTFYGVPDGDYELYASQGVPKGDSLFSDAKRVKVQGADVSGITLSLIPSGNIEGKIVLESDPKANCGKRRDTAVQETTVLARRNEPEKKTSSPQTSATGLEVPLTFTNAQAFGVPDAKGSFILRNLHRGLYTITPRLPAAGWYLHSITVRPASLRAPSINVARDGINLKPSEHLNGLTITMTEGAAALRGRVSVPEGQHLPPELMVFLAPFEREAADNVLRFFETRTQGDGSFALGNIPPGHYWISARLLEEKAPGPARSVRTDSALREQVLKTETTAKTEISFKPCERTSDYVLSYVPASSPKQ